MRLFTYGTLVDPQTMHLVAPTAEDLGPAELADHRLAFTAYSGHYEGGVPDVVPSEGDAVDGVLWSVEEDALEKVDAHEGVEEGYYRREEVTVTWRGRDVNAWVYKVVDKKEGIEPAPKVLNLMRRGAKRHDLERLVERMDELSRSRQE